MKYKVKAPSIFIDSVDSERNVVKCYTSMIVIIYNVSRESYNMIKEACEAPT